MASKPGFSSAKAIVRRLAYGVAVVFSLGLIIAQETPQIREPIDGLRAVAVDLIASRGGQTTWDRLTRRGTKDARIRELEMQVQALSRYELAAIGMADQMDQYEDILRLQGEPPARGLTARVVAEVDGPFAQTRLANAGALQGVEPGMVAVNERGLVGRVIRRGQRSSRILLITDFNSRVPVRGEVSGLRAVMSGGRDGAGVLRDRPERDNFVTGERVLTSGDGNLFPPGVLVGRAFYDGTDWRVTLAMEEGSTAYVRLIPAATIPKPEADPVEEPTTEGLVAETASGEEG